MIGLECIPESTEIAIPHRRYLGTAIQHQQTGLEEATPIATIQILMECLEEAVTDIQRLLEYLEWIDTHQHLDLSILTTLDAIR